MHERNRYKLKLNDSKEMLDFHYSQCRLNAVTLHLDDDDDDSLFLYYLSKTVHAEQLRAAFNTLIVYPADAW